VLFVALILVAALSFSPNCHQSGQIFQGEDTVPQLAARCTF
jgi:hypothetical protein